LIQKQEWPEEAGQSCMRVIKSAVHSIFYNPFFFRNTEQALNPACFAGVERLLTIVRGNR